MGTNEVEMSSKSTSESLDVLTLHVEIERITSSRGAESLLSPSVGLKDEIVDEVTCSAVHTVQVLALTHDEVLVDKSRGMLGSKSSAGRSSIVEDFHADDKLVPPHSDGGDPGRMLANRSEHVLVLISDGVAVMLACLKICVITSH